MNSSTPREVFILNIDFEKAYNHVRWEFLEEVLHKKGFYHKWMICVMQLVRGENIDFFKNKKNITEGVLGRRSTTHKSLFAKTIHKVQHLLRLGQNL